MAGRPGKAKARVSQTNATCACEERKAEGTQANKRQANKQQVGGYKGIHSDARPLSSQPAHPANTAGCGLHADLQDGMKTDMPLTKVR